MKRALLIMICVLGNMIAFGQWSTNPAENNMLIPEGREVYDYEMVVNDDGVTYFLYTRPMGNIASFIQIFDKAGYPLFDDYGLKFSNHETWSWTQVNKFLYLDSEGNAIICVSDCRNGNDRLSYTAYKISPTGEMLWGDNGINLDGTSTYALSAKLDMITLEDGSHVFAWLYADNDDSHLSIKMQRISHNGEILWDAPVLITSETVPYEYPYLVNANHNQFIVVYSKGSNKYIVANKYDFDGEAIWPQETLIYEGGFGMTPIWTFLNVVPDEKGGVFVAWHDDRFFTDFETSYVSYVKSDGSHGFLAGVGGQALSYNADLGMRCMYPKITYDAANECLYATYNEWNSSQTWTAEKIQKLDLTGQLLWGTEAREGYPLVNKNISYNSIQMAEPGYFVIFYMIYNEYSDVEALATKINGETGERVWENEHVHLSEVISRKASLESTPLKEGKYWMTIWDDSRRLPESPEYPSDKIYAQKLFIDGTFNDPSGIASIKADNSSRLYPNPLPMEAEATFTFNNAANGMVDISIYSMSGQKVAIAYNGTMGKGIQQIKWSPKNILNSGIYMAVITTSDKRESVKLIVK